MQRNEWSLASPWQRKANNPQKINKRYDSYFSGPCSAGGTERLETGLSDKKEATTMPIWEAMTAVRSIAGALRVLSCAAPLKLPVTLRRVVKHLPRTVKSGGVAGRAG